MNNKLLLVTLFSLPLMALSNDVDPANRLNPEHAPTPFSAEEIRAASPEGHYTIFLIKSTEAEPFRLVSEYTQVNTEIATFKGWREDLQGELVGDVMTATVPWTELQAHASFPEEQTTITEQSIEVPAGAWNCWVYTVTGDDGTTKEMAFAQDMAGPPVRMRIIADGEVLYSMELIESGTRQPG